MGALTNRMTGASDKKWYIKETGNVIYSSLELEAKIRSGEMTAETLVYKPPESPFSSQTKEWKKSIEYHELRKVFDSLPPS